MRRGALRVGLIGAAGEARLLAEAYVRAEGIEPAGVADPDQPDAAEALARAVGIGFEPNPERLIGSGVGGIEICLGPGSAPEWIERSAKAHKPCRTLYPAAEELEPLIDAHRAALSAGVPALLLYPPLHYAPLIKAKLLIQDEALGDVQTMRMRTVLGGNGGWWGSEPPRFDRSRGTRLLNGHAFDMLPLAALFIGPAERVFARLEPMDSAAACQLAWRYPGGRAHGVYEAINAPDTFFKSWHEPVSELFELAGTDGYLWLRRLRGMGQDRPALETYIHTKVTSYGGKMPIGWDTAFDAAVSAFADAIGGKRRRGKAHSDLDLGFAERMLRMMDAFERAAEGNKPIDLD